jgi:uroporphyrinogen decarboxylase
MSSRQPDFEHLKRVLLRQPGQQYVPIVEFGVDKDIKSAFLGRPVETLQDEVEFWWKAGYDFVPIQAGLRTLFWRGRTTTEQSAQGATGEQHLHRRTFTRYSRYQAEDRDMVWAQEGRGVITSLEEFERFPWPDPDEMDLSMLEEVKQYLPAGMKVVAYMGYIFTSAWWLMGMETFCAALYEQPELIRRLYNRIWSIQSRVAVRLLKYDVIGALSHPDDIAYAEALIVSPAHLREFVFPWYRWCGALARDRGWPYLYHSDGRLMPVLDDIVHCGFNALHPIEPKAMDIMEVKRKIGGELCLIGNIDLGYTLTRGTTQEVDAEVRERIRTVGADGGYCVGSSNSVTAYVPLRNFMAMREAAFRYGAYPLAI